MTTEKPPDKPPCHAPRHALKHEVTAEIERIQARAVRMQQIEKDLERLQKERLGLTRRAGWSSASDHEFAHLSEKIQTLEIEYNKLKEAK